MLPPSYRNFDLLIEQAPDGYRAKVLNSPVGQSIWQPVIFPFAGMERAARTTSGEQLIEPQSYGSRLFQSVFYDEIELCLVRSLDKVQTENLGLRLRLRLNDADKLADLPWEYLYDIKRKQFISLSGFTPIVRYFDLLESEPFLTISPPLRVLVILSDPVDLAPKLEVEQEWQLLEGAFKDLQRRNLAILEAIRHPTTSTLQQALQQNEFHIIHYVGHGFFDPVQSEGCLALEDDNRKARILRAEELKILLQDHHSLRLLFLNACESGRGVPENPFAGVAQRLVAQGVPAIIAMHSNVADQAAAKLAKHFYQILISGHPLDAALAEARKALYLTNNMVDWGAPIIFSRSAENRLLIPDDILPAPPCPYPGMAPFTEANSRNFFGREAEIEEAIHRLRIHPFLSIIGASGSGKSSLIGAGIIPRLRQTIGAVNRNWTICMMRPGVQPLSELSTKLNCDENASAIEYAVKTLTEHNLLLMVIDQFEELFNGSIREDALAFQQMLLRFISIPNLYVLIVVRVDFYADLLDSPLWSQIKDYRQEIAALKPQQLRAAIELPSRQVGVEVEPVLLERLLADAADEPGVLPFIQETMVLLWQHIHRRRLSITAYEAIVTSKDGRSGLEVAMARRADHAVATLPVGSKSLAQRIFLRMVQFGEGRPDTRRQQRMAELYSVDDQPALLNEALQHLVLHRLITLSQDTDQSEIKADIAHEALLKGWPQLRHWIDDRREAEQTRRRLENKAAEWKRLGFSEGGSLDEAELAEAERWLAENQRIVELGASTELYALIQKSREYVTAAQRREIERLQALERVDVEAKNARQLRRRAIALAVALLAALLLAFAASWLFNNTRVARDRETAAKVTAEANANLRGTAEAKAVHEANLAATAEAKAVSAQGETDRLNHIIAADQLAGRTITLYQQKPQMALLLAVEAIAGQVRRGERFLPSTEQVLRDLLGTIGGQAPAGQPNHLSNLALSPNGRWLVASGFDYSLYLWEMQELEAQPIILVGHTNSVNEVVFSPNNQYLVSAGSDHTIRLWRLDQLTTAPKVLQSHHDAISHLRFSPDGQWLVSTGGNIYAGETGDNAIRLWKMDSLNVPPIILAGHEHWIETIAFNHKGDLLASASWDATIRLWNLQNPQALPLVLRDHSGIIRALTFSPDDRWLASASDTIRLWDIKQPTDEPIVMDRQQYDIYALAFTPDGRWLSSAGDDNTIYLWDMKEPGTESITLTGHENAINALAFQNNGQWLASASDDKTVRLWDMVHLERAPVVLRGHEEGVDRIFFTPDGQQLITGSGGDVPIRLWRLNHPVADPVILRGHTDTIEALSFSPNGRLLATASMDQSVRIWHVNDPWTEPLLFKGHEDSLAVVVFSPDNRHVASAGLDNTIRIWDITKPADEPIVLFGHEDRIQALAFSPNGEWLASGSDDSTLRLWHMRQPNVQPHLFHNEEGWFTSVVFSTDSQWLLGVGRFDPMIRLWKMNELPTEPLLLSGHEDWVTSAVFDQSRQQFITGSWDGTVRLWPLNQLQKEPVILDGFHSEVADIVLSADGRWLANNGYRNPSIGLWDLNQLAMPPVILADPLSELLGNQVEEANAVAFSPDNRQLASGSWDATVRLWDLADPSASPVALRGFPGGVTEVLYSPNGEWLASVSGTHGSYLDISTETDPTLWLWRGSIPALVKIACHTAGRNLTLEEWQIYFPIEEYRKICSDYPVHESVTQVLIDAGREIAQQGNIQGAIEKYQEALAIEPTLKLQPEQEAKHQAALAHQWAGYELARKGELNGALTKLEKALEIDPTLNFDPQREVQQVATKSMLGQAQQLLSNHQYERVMETLIQAQTISPTLNITIALSAEQWNEICWRGGLDRLGKTILPACDRALALIPDACYPLGNRGIAYALINEIELAIADFTDDVHCLKQNNYTSDVILQVETWIAGLGAGHNLIKGIALVHNGRVEEALAFYSALRKVTPEIEISALDWNRLCWRGSLDGFAQQVLAVCEQAVLLAPANGTIRDSRGLTLALTGDFLNAIEDFQFFVTWGKEMGLPDEQIQQRLNWIEKLQNGENPFDATLLEQLRNQ